MDEVDPSKPDKDGLGETETKDPKKTKCDTPRDTSNQDTPFPKKAGYVGKVIPPDAPGSKDPGIPDARGGFFRKMASKLARKGR